MESPHPQVLKIARNPCGVIGQLLFGSIHWDLPDLSRFIFLSRVSLAENIAILLTPYRNGRLGKRILLSSGATAGHSSARVITVSYEVRFASVGP